MSKNLLSIPEVPLGSENKNILDAVKIAIETREGLRGDISDRGIVVQDLIDLGLIDDGDMEQMLKDRG